MPELPEVETIRRIVSADLVGRQCEDVDIRLSKLLRFSPMPDASAIIGRTVLSASRRAKVLTIEYSGDLSLMVHFKLSGQLAVLLPDGTRRVAGHPVPKPDGAYPHRATHATFRFSNGTVAYYSDVRQFGWIRLMPTCDVTRELDAFAFGPEATSGGFTRDYLRKQLGRRRVAVKSVLLDQTVLAGLGNIYVDEALFAAGVDPRRPARELTEAEVDRLAQAIPRALEEGIKQGGATIIHQRAFPVDGFPAVHGRAGEQCFVCCNVVEKTRVGGRGTYVCPTCQRSS